VYRSTLKLLVVLSHDYPDYLAVYYSQLAASVPAHCPQLLAFILATNPSSSNKLPDPMHPGLKAELADETSELRPATDDALTLLKDLGLLGMLEQALQHGPTEDIVAHITHAITQPATREIRFGNIAIKANLDVINAVILFIGNYAVDRASQKGSALFLPGSFDASVLSLLVHELPDESRYYFLSGMVNQLRYPSPHTKYFSHALVELFCQDISDPEESEIRQQITRLLFERIAAFWPHPWGLLITVVELMKNDKVPFFDLPFIKASPEVAGRFMSVLERT
jgi:CCR4-NOT transcription complex subunit 1